MTDHGRLTEEVASELSLKEICKLEKKAFQSEFYKGSFKLKKI